MTNREITAVAIKVFAIYILMQTLLSIPYLIKVQSMFVMPEGITWFSLGCLALFFLLGISIGLWKLSNTVIQKAYESPTKSSHNVVDQTFLLSVLGIYLTFDGVFNFGQSAVNAYIQVNTAYPPEISAPIFSTLLIFVLQVLIGMSLIIKTHGWINILKKTRQTSRKS